MSIKSEDLSNQPRSDNELNEALKQVEDSIINITKVSPISLAVQLTTIREALLELMEKRVIQAHEFSRG